LNFKEGRKAKDVEKRILDKYPRITDKTFLKSGYSELFEYDIGYTK
jgi:hypothetical protein